VDRSGRAHPSSISWVRRSIYFSQRSPTTCVVVSMRRTLSLVIDQYLAAGEAADRDNHFEFAGRFKICTRVWRPTMGRRGATR
jgi:hypothetical protein